MMETKHASEKKPKKKSSKMKTFLILCLILMLLCPLVVFFLNFLVVNQAKKTILPLEEAAKLSDIDCILVLGCRVYDNGDPSPMLHDRVEKAVELYKAMGQGKLLFSGDHGRKDYNELSAMRQMALSMGVPSEDIFLDHAGFSTYESVCRAKKVFGAERIIIVTQTYHLFRAVHIAKTLKLTAYGVGADQRQYVGAAYREVREVLARVKDFILTPFEPKPKYLGDPISLKGDGNITNDE